MIVKQIKNREEVDNMSRHNINMKELIKLIQMTQGEVKRYAKKVLKQYGYNPILRDGFIYAEGNIPVILLAHMDTVFTDEKKNIKVERDFITSTNGLGADDRAGVYGILQLIRDGYRPHVLFLEDEEIGGVGAVKFTHSNISVNAKYMIELDRQGANDCVFYDCDNEEFSEYVESFGFETAYGSFSDISEIAPALGISAVNLSVGYFNQHTKTEKLYMGILQNTLDKVKKMLDNVPEQAFEYVEAFDYYTYYKHYKAYNSYDYSDYDNYQELVTREQEDFYGKDITEVKPTCKIHSDILNRNVNLYPMVDCYVVMNGGEILWVNTKDSYFMGEDDEVYDYHGKHFKRAEVVDSDWNNLYVEDFMYTYK